ncbi:MAG: nucleoside-diphosphate sugar epimerase/dehydratase [Thiovulaceae bacterium]|nr:nucleoside-diphosphate sugar epimerase/dehydratase [Sulfurimonadaceae bacterium]
MAYNLRFNFDIPPEFMDSFYKIFLIILLLKVASLSYFKIYRVTWRFFALSEAKKLFYAHLSAYTLFTLVYLLFLDETLFARSIIVIDFFLSFVFIGFFRIAKRLILESENNRHMKKTLILGATPYTQTLIKQKKEFYVSAIITIDDSDMLLDSYISNIRVQALDALEKIVENEKIECVIFAEKIDQAKLNAIYARLGKLNIFDIKIAFANNEEATLKNLSVEDLLARHPKDLDKSAISAFIQNKSVLITGAGGSIGSEISRQCAHFGAKKLILLDHSEYNLYTIAEELAPYNPALVMQSVTDKELLMHTFATHMPQIVIHAAAYKHVPLVEENITEAIRNNVLGTKNTIDCAIAHGVEKFVLISTDKAVRPTNVMGATKRICELYAQNVVSLENTVSSENTVFKENGVAMEHAKKKTEIVAVRFGNVLGSSGSVIPKFKAQIENGGPLTVTHPEITRYFMLIPEACELVLQAASIGKGGEIFILDMGEPIKIVDLAKKMIELSGKEDIRIEFSGLRAGEKLYEELLIDESEAQTQYESIMVAGKTPYPIEKLNRDIAELLTCDDKLSKLKEIVPEFTHNPN